jgi:hypothetical protein
MMLALSPHPDTPCGAVREITVLVTRRGQSLSLVYAVAGAVGDIALPAWRKASRADELWRHTCFEAFVGPAAGGAGYAEINLSPSNQWAVYAFERYREGMTSPEGVERRDVAMDAGDDRFTLAAIVDLDRLSTPGPGPWALGLSAVIELKDGSKSYWALAHPPGPPDFHHPDAFAAILPPESP